MKLYTEFDFDLFSNEDNIDNSIKLEYIKKMIDLAQEDKKSVLPYITIALIVSAFEIEQFDSEIIKATPLIQTSFYIGIILLILSSVLYFSYWRKIHKCQIRMISCIPKLNIEKVRNLWANLWHQNNLLFRIGLFFLTIGLVLSIGTPICLRLF